jgi:hypothetical protein
MDSISSIAPATRDEAQTDTDQYNAICSAKGRAIAFCDALIEFRRPEPDTLADRLRSSTPET